MTLSYEQRERAFADAITFETFVSKSVHFTAQFRANYAATTFEDSERSLLARLPTQIDALAIVEDWCPDVVANLPIIARIADDTAAIRLHVLVRDDSHRDIADACPYEGRSHIPTYVFFSHDGTELGVIVERPGPIRVLVERFLNDFFTEHPELDRSTFPADLSDQLRAELTGRAVSLREQYRDLERTSLIDEIQALSIGDRSKPAAV